MRVERLAIACYQSLQLLIVRSLTVVMRFRRGQRMSAPQTYSNGLNYLGSHCNLATTFDEVVLAEFVGRAADLS